MKETTHFPILRFPKFDDAWTAHMMKDLLDRIIDYRGKAPPKSDDGIILITARNIRPGYLDFSTQEYIPIEKYDSWMVRGTPKKDDVLFTTEAPLGNVCMFPEQGKYALGQRAINLRAKKDVNEGRFLFYMLQTPKNQSEILKRATGSTAKGIKSSVFQKIIFSVPKIEEQRKIAAFLGAVDAKLDALRRKRALLAEYKRGVMQKLFTQEVRFVGDGGRPFADWEVRPLGEVAKTYDGTHQTPKYVESGVPFYSVEHVTSNNFAKTKFISEEVFAKESKRVILERNDILMTRIGDIGTCRLIDWDVRASFYVSLVLIKCNEAIRSDFLAQYIRTSFFQRELHHRTIHVAFPRKINLGEVGKCNVKIPHLGEQQKIADFLTAIDDKITAVDQQISQIETFKKGLLQQMFV